MNNKIENIEVSVPKGKELNDKDYMNNLLSTLKELIKFYAISITEASNEMLCKKYKELFDIYVDMQRNVFEAMFKRGWYKLEKADTNKVNEKYQTLLKELNNLNC